MMEKVKYMFFLICMLLLIGVSAAVAADDEKLASAYATDGSKKIYFSYPEHCNTINDGSCGTMVYLNENNYVTVCVPKENMCVAEHMAGAEGMYTLSDDMLVVPVHGFDNYWMPLLDVVSVGIHLSDGNGLVISAFGEYGTTGVYDLLLTVVGSIADTDALEQWLTEQWIPFVLQDNPFPDPNENKLKINASSSALVDRDGNIVVIDDECINVYHYTTMELLWQAPFEGEEYSVARNNDQSSLSFVTKSEDSYILHHVNTQERRLDSYSLSDQLRGPLHFIQDGVIYKNEQGDVNKYSFALRDVNTFSFPEHVMDVYDAVSSDSVDYIVHTAENNGNRMVCVSGFSKNNEHLFTTPLYSTKQVEAALCEAITIDGDFIVAFHPRNATDKYEPVLWVSEQGEIIHKQTVNEKNCHVNLKNDGNTDQLYLFINFNMDPTIIMRTYHPQGQLLDEQSTERPYPFSGYYLIHDTWYMWNEGKTLLVPAFRACKTFR